MTHPGPPQFIATGEDVELAPRDPDPTATYSWTLARQPDTSTVTLGEDPVEHLEPDVPGTYVARLSAPDGEHDLTVRAFPGGLAPGGEGRSGVSAGRSGGVPAAETAPATDAGSGSARADAGGPASERPRLRLDPSVDGDEAVVEADLHGRPDGSGSQSDITVEFLVDDRDDVAPAAVETSGRELRLPLTALPDRTRIHAVAVSEQGYSVPDAVEFSRADADGSDQSVTAHRPYDPPAWATNAQLYEIYVRKFTEGTNEGDTFAEIIDRLDYVESLGTDVIWLTPVLENDHAPHGYNITDFTAIASDLGTRADYERLIEAAHERDLKVLFDLVCNHSARTHPYFEAARADPDSEYRDWYEWRTDTEPETYFDWEHIANFDFDHLPVRRHLLDAVEQWAPLVDGFRCDMAWAVPDGFWREIHDYCKERDSGFLLLDETIPYVPDFQAGLFDMHFDSTTYAALREAGHGGDAEVVLDAIDGRAEIGFPDHAAFMLYAENHDETRYIVECGRPAAEAAAGAVFTLPGAPLVYAGQEFGQRGKRDQLAWDHADETLQAFVRALANTRHDQPVLSTESELRRVHYEVDEGPAARVVAYARGAGEDAVVVVLNFGADTATVTVPAAADGTDLVSGESVLAGSDTDPRTVSVDSVVVLPASGAALE